MLVKRKKTPLKVMLILVLFVSAISVVSALFYTSSEFINKFFTATYKVDIEEEFYGTWGTKKVCFVNSEDSTTPALIRISYNEFWSLQHDDETMLVLSNTVNGTNVVDKVWTNDFVDNFTAGDDGWYYYNKILGVNSKVCVLESISLNEELISTSADAAKYKTYDYELDFNFESTQATLDAVKTIWGHNVEINESGEVKWEL